MLRVPTEPSRLRYPSNEKPSSGCSGSGLKVAIGKSSSERADGIFSARSWIQLPAEMSFKACPMNALYRRTGAPTARSSSATLCPCGMCSRSVNPLGSPVPAASPPSFATTATLSASCMRITIGFCTAPDTVSTYQARPFRVEGPIGNEVLHRGCVVPGAGAQTIVKTMSLFDPLQVKFDAKPWLPRDAYAARFDLERRTGQRLPVLPYPVGVDRRDSARRSGRHMREHRQRNIEVAVRVRPPCEAPIVAQLRHSDGPA